MKKTLNITRENLNKHENGFNYPNYDAFETTGNLQTRDSYRKVTTSLANHGSNMFTLMIECRKNEVVGCANDLLRMGYSLHALYSDGRIFVDLKDDNKPMKFLDDATQKKCTDFAFGEAMVESFTQH